MEAATTTIIIIMGTTTTIMAMGTPAVVAGAAEEAVPSISNISHANKTSWMRARRKRQSGKAK
jgi:hypothetical protein